MTTTAMVVSLTSSILEHSPLGPSAGERWLNCTASVKAIEGVPPTDTFYAAEGTAAHMLSEWARAEGCSAENWIGTSILFPSQAEGEPEWEFVVDHEMVDAVDTFCEYVNGLPGDPFYEARVSYTDWVPNGFGTADDIRIDTKVCHVTDLKYGKGVPVKAYDNKQLMLYALGVYATYGFLYDINLFILTIHQPRLGIRESWEIELADLLTWAVGITLLAEEALEGRGTFKPGEWCRFCPIRGSCAARAKEVLLQATAGREGIMGADGIAAFLPHIKGIRECCKDVEAEAEKILLNRQPLPGFKLVRGRSSYAWQDPAKADKALTNKANLKVAQRFAPRVLISPAVAKKLLGKEHALVQLVPLEDEEGEGLVVKSEGKLTLAPSDDSRPAALSALEFEDLSFE